MDIILKNIEDFIEKEKKRCAADAVYREMRGISKWQHCLEKILDNIAEDDEFTLDELFDRIGITEVHVNRRGDREISMLDFMNADFLEAIDRPIPYGTLRLNKQRLLDELDREKARRR